MSTPVPGLLRLPCEIRNQIYAYLYQPPVYTAELPAPSHSQPTNPLALALKLDVSEGSSAGSRANADHLSLLLTCHKIHKEAHLLALSTTHFHLKDLSASPDTFDLRSRCLTPTQLSALKHLTLTARISHLRVLNEAWAGLPFGHPSLRLDVLTIYPQKPQCVESCYAEVADLSQAHTLAYILAETFKGLRNVGLVEIRNRQCFEEGGWRVLYRSLVLRLWRWGGGCCGVRFDESGEDVDLENRWFRIYFQEDEAIEKGREVGEEVVRLAGGRMPELTTAGF